MLRSCFSGESVPVLSVDLSPWGCPTATDVTRPAGGTNNAVLILDAGGQRWVWRRYDNLTVSQVRREHALLDWLAPRLASFRLPVPVHTARGESVHILPDGRVATLTRAIEGRRPRRQAQEITATALAFAELLVVLADAPRKLAVHEWSTAPLLAMYPDTNGVREIIRRCRGLGIDVGWFMRTLDADHDLRAELETTPQQLVHGDIALSNALISDGGISGLLDFEISGWDARVTDVAAALTSLGGDPGTTHGRADIDRLRTVFDTALELKDAELRLLPACVLQRCAGSVLWRARRWKARLGTFEEIATQMLNGSHHARHISAYERPSA